MSWWQIRTKGIVFTYNINSILYCMTLSSRSVKFVPLFSRLLLFQIKMKMFFKSWIFYGDPHMLSSNLLVFNWNSSLRSQRWDPLSKLSHSISPISKLSDLLRDSAFINKWESRHTHTPHTLVHPSHVQTWIQWHACHTSYMYKTKENISVTCYTSGM